MKHEFQVGQFVELKPSVMRAAAAGPYEITRLMPEPDVGSESPRYRIKSLEEVHQRIVPESELTLLSGPTAEPSGDMSQATLLAAPDVSALGIED